MFQDVPKPSGKRVRVCNSWNSRCHIAAQSTNSFKIRTDHNYLNRHYNFYKFWVRELLQLFS